VIEGGAGRGRLCRDIFLSVERCGVAMRYVMVERSEVQRAEALERVAASCFADREEMPVAATGALPTGPLNGAVIANELLDNLAPRLLERRGDIWMELYVENGRFVGREAPRDAAAMATALAPHAEQGARIPLQLKAAVWMRRALGALSSGGALVADYGVLSTQELASLPPEEWLRAFRAHRRNNDVLEEPGSRDITCDVAFDQLPPAQGIVTQSEWLAEHGLEELTSDARRRWSQAVASPTSADVAARTVLDEARALTAPGGLGDFLVAEWRV